MLDTVNRFVFVHIPKTAGQSVRSQLYCKFSLSKRDDKDILVGPNRYKLPGPEDLTHCTYREIVACSAMSNSEMRSLFKFAFVRDPLERALSIYKFKGWEGHPFKKFVKEYLLGKLWYEEYYFVRPQADFVTNHDGDIALDFVGRYETLSKDWEVVAARLGLGYGQKLPHLNNSGRLNFKIPKDIGRVSVWMKSGVNKGCRLLLLRTKRNQVDAVSRGIIYRAYEKDYDLFGY